MTDTTQSQALIEQVRTYHRTTKHSPTAYAPGPGYLDWASQPNPFRRYANTRTVPLPLCRDHPPVPFSQLYTDDVEAQPFDISQLSLFLELSMGLSAWKQFGSEGWALRHNPSSGNLHPTELYLVIWRPIGDALTPGIYHYAPQDHALECRKEIDEQTASRIIEHASGRFGAVGLTSVHWREEWKYGARALRYCQHDVGHALASLRYGAATVGWPLALDTDITDAEIRNLLGLRQLPPNVEAEHPDLIAFLGDAPPNTRNGKHIWRLITDCPADFTGAANRLSPERVRWPQIEEVLPALEKPTNSAPRPFVEQRPSSFQSIKVSDSKLPTAESIIRQRRSAQRMKAGTPMTRAQFFHMLMRTLPNPTRVPFDAFPFQPAIHLLLFVHTIDDIAPGLYALLRTDINSQAFIEDCQNTDLTWRPVTDCPLPLYELIAPADVRKVAAQISCGQSIAGNSAFSVGMIANMAGTLEREGAWSYRRLFWEAGLIGQILYLEAEAQGASGTGIGCYFDDAVHQLLGLPDEGQWQSLYHFTVGTALPDQRLTTRPGYYHLDR